MKGKDTMERRIRLIGSFLAVSLILGACGGTAGETTTTAGAGTTATTAEPAESTTTAPQETTTTAAELVDITAAMATGSPFYYGYRIAMALGFFEEGGVNFDFQVTGGSSEVGLILASGTADIGAAGFSAVLPAMAGGGIYPFFVHTYGEPYDILVPTDSDIQDIVDLEGQTIGLSELAGGEVPLVRALLETNGLDPDTDVTYLEVGTNPGTIQIAFERGDIAAYSSGVSDTAILLSGASGFDVRSIAPDFVGELAAGGLLTTDEHKDDLELLASIGRAAAKGHLVAYTNPDAAVCILKEVIPEEFVDEEAGRASMEGSMLSTTAPQNPDGTYRFSAGLGNLENWERYIGIYVSGGILEEPFDPAPLVIDLEDEVNDFDQQAVIDMAEGLPTDC
jgi:NitT/TauT family transport system substrate-binding protein